MAKKTEIREKIGGSDRISVVMTLLYVVFIGLGFAIAWKIAKIQLHYEVDAKVINHFRPASKKIDNTPRRGNILSCDGRPLAISVPKYDIYMDCTVRKQEFIDIDRRERERREIAAKAGRPVQDPPKKEGEQAEELWQEKAGRLSVELAKIFPKRTAVQYETAILEHRAANNRTFLIAKDVNYETLQMLKGLPLFREGRYKGGLVESRHDERIYPYGSLARRVIGYIKEDRRIGLEGSFNFDLHGTDGYEWVRSIEGDTSVHDYDSTSLKVTDGNDLRSTINIDFQDIADKALRRQIENDPRIRAGVAILLEASTGAVRAMVNLSRSATDSLFGEINNLALTEVAEQGSVMKTTTLVSLVEDGFVPTLDMTIPTNHGFVRDREGRVLSCYKQDAHIVDYERDTGSNSISVLHGFEISSNYVFAQLAETYYGQNPRNFFDKIYSYKLGESFAFDITGLGSPVVITPDNKSWSRPVLGTTAYGYSLAVTPLHVATFYNAIANKGLMQKPYLVESVEKNGVVLKKYGPSVLNHICSKATADTVTRALKAVTEEGTAKRLKDAKLSVAGKTGTAQIILPAKDRGADPYHDRLGRKMNQGTFVGFFPAENPKYTILVSVYSYLSSTSFYGGTYPALAVKEIVDKIYAIVPDWNTKINREAAVPIMTAPSTIQSSNSDKVPDVKDLGLKDALAIIENSGYVCSYTGSGHVSSQNPKAGTALEKGKTVELVLK